MAEDTESKRYAFFLGCIAPNRYPQLEKSTRYVMERLGYELVDLERAACCPAPGVFRSFDKYDWMVAGARNLCIAEKMGLNVLTICNGCFGTLQDINKHLKGDEGARNKVNEKLKLIGDYEFKGTIEVKHFAQLLASDIGPREIQPYIVRKIHAKVAIHYGCHLLKPMWIRQVASAEGPRFLEEYIEALGMESVEFKDKLTCCGAGGGVKSSYADTSMTIFAEKIKNIDAVKPDFILDTCPFCHLQFETGQDYMNKSHGAAYDYPVIHLAQITAYCMGMDQNFVGLQYQMMGKKYLFTSEEIENQSAKHEAVKENG